MIVNTFGPYLGYKLVARTMKTVSVVGEKIEKLYKEVHQVTDSTMYTLQFCPGT